jgi:catechol 2,3-dioxygenase-like lactoylglutathione lyase family enzyme
VLASTVEAVTGGRLAYLYLGTPDVRRAAAFYVSALGAEVVWAFDRFGARVAALRIGDGPLLLLADHRPAGECRLLYRVDDISAAVAELRAAGATDLVEIGVPPGPCVICDDAAGNPIGVIEETRPGRMEAGFANADNSAALRPPWPFDDLGDERG